MLLIAVMMMAALSINAQSIKGTWKVPADDTQIFFTFGDSDELNILISNEFEDEEMAAAVKVTIPGTYSVTGSKLRMLTDKEKFDVKVEKLEIKGDDKGMEGILKPMLEEVAKAEKEELIDDSISEEMTIVSVTDDKLVIKIGEEVVNFEKVK